MLRISLMNTIVKRPCCVVAAAVVPPTTTPHNFAATTSQPRYGRRHISVATPPLAMPLDEFRDPTSRQQRMSETVGRSWKARELRRKSFDDLHKLWLVLYKERNMLLTEQQLSRRKQLVFPQPERLQKVGKSMGAIRQVLGERKRERVKNHLMGLEEKKEEENEEPQTGAAMAKETVHNEKKEQEETIA